MRNHDELTLDKLTDDEREEVFAAFGPEESMQIYGRGLKRRLPPMLDGDPRRIRMVYSLLFSLPGTPVLFYGEEIGMGENLAAEGRQAVRTPMQWSADRRNGGFSTAAPSRLPNPVVEGAFGPAHVNVADQRRDPDSLLAFVTLLVQRYRECPELGWGDLELLDQPHASVLAHCCRWDGAALVAVHNLGPESLTVPLRLDGLRRPAPSGRPAGRRLDRARRARPGDGRPRRLRLPVAARGRPGRHTAGLIMLFGRPDLDAIANGSIDLAFRRWTQPRVRVGSRLRTAVGVLEVDAVTVVRRVTAAEARRAGYPSVAALEADLDRGQPGDTYRVQLHLAGPDPRVELRNQVPTADEVVKIIERLGRLDRASTCGPWTTAVLQMIAERPAVRAPELAASFGRETAAVQDRRAQAEGARPDREPADRLPALATRRGRPRRAARQWHGEGSLHVASATTLVRSGRATDERSGDERTRRRGTRSPRRR